MTRARQTALALCLVLCGCTSFHEEQGDKAVERGDHWSASISYELALEQDPDNEDLRAKYRREKPLADAQFQREWDAGMHREPIRSEPPSRPSSPSYGADYGSDYGSRYGGAPPPARTASTAAASPEERRRRASRTYDEATRSFGLGRKVDLLEQAVADDPFALYAAALESARRARSAQGQGPEAVLTALVDAGGLALSTIANDPNTQQEVLRRALPVLRNGFRHGMDLSGGNHVARVSFDLGPLTRAGDGLVVDATARLELRAGMEVGATLAGPGMEVSASASAEGAIVAHVALRLLVRFKVEPVLRANGSRQTVVMLSMEVTARSNLDELRLSASGRVAGSLRGETLQGGAEALARFGWTGESVRAFLTRSLSKGFTLFLGLGVEPRFNFLFAARRPDGRYYQPRDVDVDSPDQFVPPISPHEVQGVWFLGGSDEQGREVKIDWGFMADGRYGLRHVVGGVEQTRDAGRWRLEDAVIAATHEDGTPERVPVRFAGSNLVVRIGGREFSLARRY